MKNGISANKLGWLYAFVHFAVETACFFYIFSNIQIGIYGWIVALLYDAMAFLPQNAMGLIADKFPRAHLGVLGLLITLIALLLPFGLISVVVLAIGNAIVHVDGAEKTLRDNAGKISPNAVFVGGGSFGVVTGRLLGVHSSELTVLIPILLLVLSAAAILLMTNKRITSGKQWLCQAPEVVNPSVSNSALLVIILFAVAVRGYIGYAIPTGWSITETHLVILFAYMGIGKALGGFVVDWLGYRKATLISIIGALPFLLLGDQIPLVSLTGVLLYSMSMPVTVGIVYSRFNKMPGFAFGITTIGLFLGSAPDFFIDLPNLLTQQLVVVALATISATLIFICTKKEIKND